MAATTIEEPPARQRPAPLQKRSGGGLLIYFVALVLIGLMLAPIAYIILGGFRSNSEITVDPSGLPTVWNWQNYAEVLVSPVFWTQVGNSTIAAVATTLLAVALGLMAAFALSRYSFRGRGLIYAVFAAGLMFPMTVAITPLYIVVRNLGLMNSLPESSRRAAWENGRNVFEQREQSRINRILGLKGQQRTQALDDEINRSERRRNEWQQRQNRADR